MTKTCFIAMPISTPESTVSEYMGDSDHFRHVLEHLFRPAIETAGFLPIPPQAAGADVIQATIIDHLQDADLVLCDISTLNANVFFELGIRTALNKPTVLVRDDKTTRIPFDTSIVNHLTYSSRLDVWELPDQIQRLTQHITESYEQSRSENSMWKRFGAQVAAKSAQPDIHVAIQEARKQIEALDRKMGSRFVVIDSKAFRFEGDGAAPTLSTTVPASSAQLLQEIFDRVVSTPDKHDAK